MFSEWYASLRSCTLLTLHWPFISDPFHKFWLWILWITSLYLQSSPWLNFYFSNLVSQISNIYVLCFIELVLHYLCIYISICEIWMWQFYKIRLKGASSPTVAKLNLTMLSSIFLTFCLFNIFTFICLMSNIFYSITLHIYIQMFIEWSLI